MLIARIRSHVPADAPVIIAGDFNDWRHRLGRRLVENLGVREVFANHETRRAAFARRAAGYIRRTLEPATANGAGRRRVVRVAPQAAVARAHVPERVPAAAPRSRLRARLPRRLGARAVGPDVGEAVRPRAHRRGARRRVKFEEGNRVELLCGGSEFFPALIAAIESATQEVYLETYIYHDDDTGRRVTDVLADAARRGVQVRVTVDGFGSSNLAPAIRERFEQAGVEYVIFRPENYSWRSGLKWFSRKRLRRLHRKLAMVDRRVAFCGGINVLDDLNDPNHGPLEAPRFDFAAQVEGPIVGHISAYMLNQWLRLDWERMAKRRHGLQQAVDEWFTRREWATAHPSGANVRVAFVPRDNLRHRRRIEYAYLAAIRLARTEVLLCNAYYFPGRRFRTALIRAAKRGVRVRLLLQGRPEYPVQHFASQVLYDELLAAGIEIHEYTSSFLHAKVGVVDDRWATVGSSNIDPFSLFLAREANLVVLDEPFAAQLRERVEDAIAHCSVPVQAEKRRQARPRRARAERRVVRGHAPRGVAERRDRPLLMAGAPRTASGDLVVLRPEGLYCPPGDFYIDPWRPVERAVITHAHGDHARMGHAHYLAIDDGAGVLRTRLGPIDLQTLRYGERIDHHGVRVSLHPAGHVLGSAQVRLEHGGRVWVASGDYKFMGRADDGGDLDVDPTCPPFEPVRCDVFITESTFGLPIYRWQPQREIFADIDAWWRGERRRGPRVGAVLLRVRQGAAHPRRRRRVDRADLLPRRGRAAESRVSRGRRRAAADDAGLRGHRQARCSAAASCSRRRRPPGSPWMRRFGEYSDAFASRLDAAARRAAATRARSRLRAVGPRRLARPARARSRRPAPQRVIVTHGQVPVMVRWLCENGLDAEAFETEYGDDAETGPDAVDGARGRDRDRRAHRVSEVDRQTVLTGFSSLFFDGYRMIVDVRMLPVVGFGR